MLDAVVVFIVVLLIGAGVLVILGPRNVVRRVASLRRPGRLPSAFTAPGAREVVPPALNPKTQRVAVASARLVAWMRAHGHEDVAREIRTAAARMTGNEAAGLYALQNAIRRIRIVNVTDPSSHERLKALVAELRTAVEDRFEQLELLPFKRP